MSAGVRGKWRIPRIIAAVLGLALLGYLLFAAGVLGMIVWSISRDARPVITQRITSPDGRMELITAVVRGNAVVRYSTKIALVPRGGALDDDHRIFEAYDPVHLKLRWIDPAQVAVTADGADIFYLANFREVIFSKAASDYREVRITYSIGGTRVN